MYLNFVNNGLHFPFCNRGCNKLSSLVTIKLEKENG